jgi:small subunit ribosomal protein S20
MPITKSVKKALHASERKRVFNLRSKRAIHRAVSNARKIAGSGTVEEIGGAISSAFKAIDKATKRGVLKKNTASRQKSRLSRMAVQARKKE